MNTLRRTLVAFFTFLGIIHFAFADQYTFKFPVYVESIGRYWGYDTSGGHKSFVDYFGGNVVNMMLNASTVLQSNLDEVLSASEYSSVATTSELNMKGVKEINNLWARDFMNELNMYRMQYIHQRYLSSTQQLTGETVENPAFEDINFDEPFDRMMVYMWAYHLEKSYQEFMENAATHHSTWQSITEEINTEIPKENEDEEVTT